MERIKLLHKDWSYPVVQHSKEFRANIVGICIHLEQAYKGKELAEHIVNIHNKSLES